jgi:hypothetical protein
MSHSKPKIILFLAVVLQTLLAGALLSVLLPYYFWGPPPADETAMQAYADEAGGLIRLIAAIWAGAVCIAYYVCFLRERRRRPQRD